MNDEPIPTYNDPNFQRVDEGGGPRAMLPPHIINDDSGMARWVYPACCATFGAMEFHDGRSFPTLRIDAAHSAMALVLVLTAGDLRSLGAAFAEAADKLEGNASALASEALAKAQKGGGA